MGCESFLCQGEKRGRIGRLLDEEKARVQLSSYRHRLFILFSSSVPFALEAHIFRDDPFDLHLKYQE